MMPLRVNWTVWIWIFIGLVFVAHQSVLAKKSTVKSLADKSKAKISPAATAKTEALSRKIRLQRALVGPEGAVVYALPDFDAEVLAQLPPDREVFISMKTRAGAGGLGLFYLLKLQSNKMGYVVDTEVVPQFQSKGKSSLGAAASSKVNPEFERSQDEIQRSELRLKPVYLTRYFGGGVGAIDFSEKFGADVYRSWSNMASLRMTGPGWISDVLPVDLNLAFSLSPPAYYSNLTSQEPTGFWAILDLSLLLPFKETPDFLLHYGLGPTLTYTQFSLPLAGRFLDSSELRLGAAFHLGGVWRVGQWGLRADAKYYFEVERYFGLWLALQRQY